MQFSIGTFEGPLDLLLALIRREEMDIIDIDLCKITHQYLEVMESSKDRLDLEEGGEFIHMASTLLYLKSKSLLPQVEESEEEFEISSAESLIEALAKRSEYLKAAEQLNQAGILNRDIWSCPGRIDFIESSEAKIETEGIFSLFKACQQALKRASTYSLQVIFPSTSEWIHRIKDYFVKGEKFSFRKLVGFSNQPIIHQVLLSFLSVLELGKIGVVSLSQVGSDIHVVSLKNLDENTMKSLNVDSDVNERSSSQ